MLNISRESQFSEATLLAFASNDRAVVSARVDELELDIEVLTRLGAEQERVASRGVVLVLVEAEPLARCIELKQLEIEALCARIGDLCVRRSLG